MNRRAFVTGLGAVLVTVSACASVEPKPNPPVAQLQHIVDRVADIYRMSNPPTVLTAGDYCARSSPNCLNPTAMAEYHPRLNEVVLRKKLLEPEYMRGATQLILAHELGHYLLGHEVRESLDWYNEQWERDANAKAVEILIRLGVLPDTAVRGMYLLLRSAQANTPSLTHVACDEIADLLRRYPEHPDDLTDCASTTDAGKAEPAPTVTK